MNKILLSGLAGLAVINAAVAVPSPADRRALCEKHPDKYVWVEKTEACIPINPCESDNKTIKESYCVETDFVFPTELEKLELILNRYAEKVLNTNIDHLMHVETGCMGMFTSDEGYYVFKPAGFEPANTFVSRYQEAIGPAAWAYGYINTDLERPSLYHAYHAFSTVPNESVCDDIRDFASLLSDYLFDSEYKDGTCWIKDNTENRFKNR